MNNKKEAMKNAAKAPEVKETVTATAKTTAAPVEEKKAAETVKKTEAVKEEAEKKTEAPKDEAEKKTEAPKEEAAKKTEASAKKAEPAKKAPVKKTEAPKKAAAKKEEPEMKASVFVEYEGKQIAAKDVLETAKNDYISKHEDAVIETIELYVKPEENAAYYVVNGEGCEEFKILL